MSDRFADDARFDLLCVGFACYDLIFTVDHHPGPDEKTRANAFIGCGGGTAANAAQTAARLGHRTAFAGYLGDDLYGHEHLAEFHAAGVDTRFVVHGQAPTPISSILVKPNGARTIVNFRGTMPEIAADQLAFQSIRPRAVLFDGHQPRLAMAIQEWAAAEGIPTVVDADTVSPGNAQLVERCDYVVASERFSMEFTGAPTPALGMGVLAKQAPNVVVTLGERGLIWQLGESTGAAPAFSVAAVDTTGAGDAFHGAFAAGVAAGMAWQQLLRYASAAGALCCTKHGARLGIPGKYEVERFLASNPAESDSLDPKRQK